MTAFNSPVLGSEPGSWGLDGSGSPGTEEDSDELELWESDSDELDDSELSESDELEDSDSEEEELSDSEEDELSDSEDSSDDAEDSSDWLGGWGFELVSCS